MVERLLFLSDLISTPQSVSHNIFQSRTSRNEAFWMCRRSVRAAAASGGRWGYPLLGYALPVPVPL